MRMVNPIGLQPRIRTKKTEDEATMPMHIITYFRMPGHLCVASLCLMFLLPSHPAAAADRAGDEFLTGYVASILERDLLWERDSYVLKIVNGVATITLFKDDPMRREAAGTQLCSVDGLQRVAIVVKTTDAAKPGPVGRLVGITGEGEALNKVIVATPLTIFKT